MLNLMKQDAGSSDEEDLKMMGIAPASYQLALRAETDRGKVVRLDERRYFQVCGGLDKREIF